MVLTFWTIGCPGCEAEREAMSRLAARYADSSVVFLAFHCRGGERILRDYLSHSPYRAVHVSSAKEIADLFHVQGYPTHIIIDSEGRIFTRKVGGSDRIDADIERLIQRCRSLSQ